MFKCHYFETGTSIGSFILLGTTSCFGRVAGNDASPYVGLISLFNGIVSEPSSLGLLRPPVSLRASSGTVSSAVLGVEQTELLACEGAIGREVLSALFFIG